MITGTDRRGLEQQFHDQQARERAARFRLGQASLEFEDDSFLDHETWIRPAFDQLGPLAGKEALDYGCGHGMAAVVLARAGAKVTAFDLSPGYAREARERARANGGVVNCVVAAGEDLPFPDDSFDVVWGNAILHHLALPKAGEELHRVMKPGGVAVFCEPWGGNPLLTFARKHLPYPGKDRTPDESPLTLPDLLPLQLRFSEVHLSGSQLFEMIRRVWPNPFLCRVLRSLDSRLLKCFPRFNNWCRYTIITLRRAP